MQGNQKFEKIRIELLEKAHQTNMGPGIYKMLDNNDQIIYIGKAKNLRNRVRSYFEPSAGNDHPKTKVLVTKIKNFEVVLTDSEAEALILESILIKKHKPRYNIALKDDKTYPYLLVERSHGFPKLVYGRRYKRTKTLEVYGPYVSAGSLRKAIQFLNQAFRLRDCSDTEFSNRSRPCMNYQIGICSAPCTNYISIGEYKETLDQALKILQGKGKEVLLWLENKMNEFSEKQEYELAAHTRDQMVSLQDTFRENSQKIAENSMNRLGALDKDIIGMHRKDDSVAFAVVFVRNGKVIDSSTYYMKVMLEDSNEEVLSQFLAQFYLTKQTEVENIGNDTSSVFLPGTNLKQVPPEIILPMPLGDEVENLFQESLQKLSVPIKLSSPGKKGTKSELQKMAEKNAEEAFSQEQIRLGDIYKALSELKSRLRLQKYPRRIECFDISNLGDTGIVASRVVFIEGRPEKSLYRHYKLKEVRSQNDFAAMQEVLSRRLLKSSKYASEENNEEAPDLLIVDGGKGQLSVAASVLEELNVTGIDLVALAKAKVEKDFSSEEITSTAERVFKPGRMNPIVLIPGTNPYFLMQRIRDEAHRFAITFQRKQRKIE